MDLDAYLARVGYAGPRSATLETLRGLHLAHGQAIAFENLDPILGWPVRLDLGTVEEKLVRSGRGGYCFEQNALFAAALRELGFEVTGLAARVVWNAPENATAPRSHMLLKVTVGSEPYLADVGFGGQTLTGPLRLVAEEAQSTPHEAFRLVPLENESGARELKLQSWVAGEWKSLYRFDLQPQLPAEYEIASYFLSTHPTSHFRNGLRVARPAPGRRFALSSDHFAVHHLDGPSERRALTGVDDVKRLLEQVFGLTLPAATLALDEALARVCRFDG